VWHRREIFRLAGICTKRTEPVRLHWRLKR
jgi:hypothetical protein